MTPKIEDSHKSPEVTQQDLDIVLSKMDEAILATQNWMVDQFKLIDARTDAMEKQIATLVVGLGEQAAFIEGFAAVVNTLDENTQDIFQNQVESTRKMMFEIMESTANVMADTDPGVSTAMGDVVSQRKSVRNED